MTIVRIILKWFIISLIVVSSFYSAFFNAYSFVFYGPNNYEHLPAYPILRILWAVGIPGSILLLVIGIGLIGALLITFSNWIFNGKFKFP